MQAAVSMENHTGLSPATSQESLPVASGQIGVFDSGIGGLSVLRHVMQDVWGQQPDADKNADQEKTAPSALPHLLYVADTAFAPYGERTQAQISERVLHIVRSLQPYRLRALVLACNTATAAASLLVRQQFPDLLLVGMEPGLKPGVLASRLARRSHKVGVLATRATLASPRYQALQQRIIVATRSVEHPDVQFVVQPCDGLAAAIERGELDTPTTVALVWQYVQPLLAQDVDTIVLGCTHYPFIRPVIERLLVRAGKTGADVITIIETGAAVSRQLCRLTGLPLHKTVAPQTLASTKPVSLPAAGHITGLTTGNPDDLKQAFSHFLGLDVGCHSFSKLA